MIDNVLQHTIRGLILASGIFLTILGLTAYLTLRATELNHWTIQTHKTIEALKDSLSALQDIEIGERGYLLTGSRDFLGPYNWGKSNFESSLNEIRALTKGDPAEQRNLNQLEKVARERIEATETAVSQRAAEKETNIELQEHGHELMREYRACITKMTDEARTKLSERATILQDTQRLLWFFAGFSAFCALGILGWVYLIISQAITIEQTRVKQLKALNEGLTRENDQRTRVERSLKETTIRLSNSNADLQQFAYVASHDLQEPLRAVSGFLTLLSKKHQGSFDEESKQWITHSVEGAQRMRALINDLLIYARVESKGKPLVRFQLTTALDQARRDLAMALAESQAELVVSELPEISGDPGQMAQVFQNLIGNAIKFRAPDTVPVVKISAEKSEKEDEWEVSVSDNGIGFSMEHAQRIFVIFQRLQGREEYKGTGIGLALCKKIVARHGGRIWVNSTVGEGSTFTFTLPISKAENNGGEQREASQDSDGGR
jgi:signal transduction histidine kinase